MAKFESDKTYVPKGVGYTNKIGAARKLAEKKFGKSEPSMVSDYATSIFESLSFKEIELELMGKKKGGSVKTYAKGGSVKTYAKGSMVRKPKMTAGY